MNSSIRNHERGRIASTRVVLASFDRVPSAKGAAQHILSNAEHLSQWMDVSLVTLGRHPMFGWRHLPLTIDEPNWLRRAMQFHRRMKRIFELNPFDVYHVRSPFEGLAVPEGKAIVYEVNGFASIEMPYHYPKAIERWKVQHKLQALELKLLERSRRVICTNPVTLAHLEDLGVPSQRIAIVPNRPSFELVESQPEKTDSVLNICYIGTLTRWQGMYDAVRALEALVDVPFHLHILAPSTGRADFWRWLSKRAIASNVTVDDPLPKDELRTFLASQDLGLAPLAPCGRNLLQGCMPIKVLDYMAAGLPVVASDIPVNRHLLGDSEYLYQPYSLDSLTAQITKAHRDTERRRARGEVNKIRLQQHFSKGHQERALFEVYSSIVEEINAV